MLVNSAVDTRAPLVGRRVGNGRKLNQHAEGARKWNWSFHPDLLSSVHLAMSFRVFLALLNIIDLFHAYAWMEGKTRRNDR